MGILALDGRLRVYKFTMFWSRVWGVGATLEVIVLHYVVYLVLLSLARSLGKVSLRYE